MTYGTEVRKDRIISLILGDISAIKQEVKRLDLVKKEHVPKFAKPIRDITTKRLIGLHGSFKQRLLQLKKTERF